MEILAKQGLPGHIAATISGQCRPCREARFPMPDRRIIAALALAFLAVPAAANDKPGRFIMSPADGGFVRLDTETGAMALCKRTGDTWDCAAMSDSSKSLQQEADRLAAENKELKAEVRRLEEVLGLDGDKKDAPGKRAERPGGDFRLPSEQDVDKAIDYVERMFKKFRDKLKELDSGPEKRGPVL
jgi:hypothetical protein